jgi:uncharacterized membrane protein
MTARTAALVGAVVVSNVAGNLALAWGMKHGPADAGPIRALFEPVVILGIALLIAWTLMRLALLERKDLSWVLPVTSVGYVLNAAAGAVFLHEPVSAARWAGTLLIVGGASLVGLSEAREPGA